MAKRIKLTTANVAGNNTVVNNDARLVIQYAGLLEKKNQVLEELKRGFANGFQFIWPCRCRYYTYPCGCRCYVNHRNRTYEPGCEECASEVVTINLKMHNTIQQHLGFYWAPSVRPSIWHRYPLSSDSEDEDDDESI